jgi:hypothetical protein
MVQGDVHDACFVLLGPVRSGPAKHDLLGAGKIIAIHDSVPRANGASYNVSGLSFKSPHSRSSPGPCRSLFPRCWAQGSPS